MKCNILVNILLITLIFCIIGSSHFYAKVQTYFEDAYSYQITSHKKPGSENEDILEKYLVNSMEIHILVAFI